MLNFSDKVISLTSYFQDMSENVALLRVPFKQEVHNDQVYFYFIYKCIFYKVISLNLQAYWLL